jgi:hypothetical protein
MTRLCGFQQDNAPDDDHVVNQRSESAFGTREALVTLFQVSVWGVPTQGDESKARLPVDPLSRGAPARRRGQWFFELSAAGLRPAFTVATLPAVADATTFGRRLATWPRRAPPRRNRSGLQFS